MKKVFGVLCVVWMLTGQTWVGTASADILYAMDGWENVPWDGTWWDTTTNGNYYGNPGSADDIYFAGTGSKIIGQVGSPLTAAVNTINWSGNNPGLTINDSGSSLTTLGIVVGHAAGKSGTITQNAGTVQAKNTTDSPSWFSVGSAAGGTGTYAMNGGTLKVGGYGGSVGEYGTALFTQTAGNVEVYADGGQPFNVGRFAGSNGTYRISGGSLQVNSINTFNVGPEGTGVLNVIGKASTLTDDGDFTEGANGTLAFDINGNSANGALGISSLTVGGVVNLAGMLNVSLINGSSLLSSYMLIDKTSLGAINGTFAGLPEGSLIGLGGTNYSLSYVGGNGNDVTLTQTPEPGTVALLTTGLLGLLAYAWRKRK